VERGGKKRKRKTEKRNRMRRRKRGFGRREEGAKLFGTIDGHHFYRFLRPIDFHGVE
jgi:hypothetical protein